MKQKKNINRRNRNKNVNPFSHNQLALLPGDGKMSGPGEMSLTLKPLNRPTFLRVDLIRTGLAVILPTLTAGISGTLKFRLSDFYQSSTYAGLFDTFRITKMEVLFRGANMNLITASYVPTISTAIDFTGLTSAPTVAQVQSYANSMTAPMVATHVRKFRPRTLAAGNCTTSATSLVHTMSSDTWINSAYPDTFYYGLVYATDFSSNNTPEIVVDAKITVEFACVN
jgi:hypothetical protein